MLTNADLLRDELKSRGEELELEPPLKKITKSWRRRARQLLLEFPPPSARRAFRFLRARTG
jgi:hypothetical protein